MSEQIYIFFILGNFYFLLLWSKYYNLKHLIISSIFLTLAVGTRYDAWPIFIGSFILVIIISISYRKYIIKNSIIYFILPFLFILWWFIHNFIYYGDPLEFARGKFSTLHQLNYYIEHGRLLTKNNFLLSLKVYLFTVLIYCGYLYFILAIIGLVYYLYKNKFNPKSFVPYILLICFPATLILLYKGQIIIENQVSEPEGFFNTRYGLYFFPAVVIFSGYFILFLKQFKEKHKLIKILFILIFIQQIMFFINFPYNIPGLLEGIYNKSKTNENLCQYLKENYKGGLLLYDNTVFALLPKCKVYLKNRITFHTPKLGILSMEKPSEYVDWILFDSKLGVDKIYDAMKDNKDFQNNFELKFSEEGIELYGKKSGTMKIP